MRLMTDNIYRKMSLIIDSVTRAKIYFPSKRMSTIGLKISQISRKYFEIRYVRKILRIWDYYFLNINVEPFLATLLNYIINFNMNKVPLLGYILNAQF